MVRRVNVTGEVKCFRHGAAAKASPNRANKYDEIDPKPDDLSMSRLKVEYNPLEDRTDVR